MAYEDDEQNSPVTMPAEVPGLQTFIVRTPKKTPLQTFVVRTPGQSTMPGEDEEEAMQRKLAKSMGVPQVIGPPPASTEPEDVAGLMTPPPQRDIRQEARRRWARLNRPEFPLAGPGLPESPETLAAGAGVEGIESLIPPAGQTAPRKVGRTEDYPWPPERTEGKTPFQEQAMQRAATLRYQAEHPEAQTPNEQQIPSKMFGLIPMSPEVGAVAQTPLVPVGKGVQWMRKKQREQLAEAGAPEWLQKAADVPFIPNQIAAGAIEGMSTPENLGIVAATGGLGKIAAIPGAVGTIARSANSLLSASFLGSMAPGAVVSIYHAGEAFAKGDYDGTVANLENAGINTVMAAMIAQHAAKSPAGTIQPAVERIRTRAAGVEAKEAAIETARGPEGQPPFPEAEVPLPKDDATPATPPPPEELTLTPSPAEPLKRVRPQTPAAPPKLIEAPRAEGAPMAFDIEETPGATGELFPRESTLFPPTGQKPRFTGLERIRPTFTGIEEVPREPALEAPAPVEVPVKPQIAPLEAPAPVETVGGKPSPLPLDFFEPERKPAAPAPGTEMGSRLRVNIGNQEARTILFPDRAHADLFAMTGRFRRQISGEVGRPKADYDRVARQLGVDRRDVLRISQEYKKAVMNVARAAKEGDTITAPKFEEVTRRLTEAEQRARAAEERIRQLEEKRGPQFSLKSEWGYEELSREAADEVIAAARKEFPGTRVKQVRFQDELPSSLVTELGDRIVDAVYDPSSDTAYLIRSELKDAPSAAERILHEITHRGTATAMTRSRRFRNLESLAKSNRLPEFLETPEGAPYELGPKEVGTLTPEELKLQKSYQAEELVARTAEKVMRGDLRIPGVADRAVSRIREALRRINPKLEWTDKDILSFLNSAAAPLMHERPAIPAGIVRPSRVVEATPDEIEAVARKIAEKGEQVTPEEARLAEQKITPVAEEPVMASRRGTPEYERAMRAKSMAEVIKKGMSLGKDVTHEEIGEFLEDWVEAHKGKADYRDTEELIRRGVAMGLKDVMFQLSRDPKSVEFYTKDLDHAMGILKEIGAVKPKDEGLFKVILSGSSFGKTPPENLETALGVLNQYRKTGKFPPKKADGSGWGGTPEFEISANKLNRLLKSTGSEEAMLKWLDEDHPIGEIREYAPSVGGKKDALLPGMFVLGPKGGPFALNLSGRPKWLTVDRWQARFGNRMLGDLLKENPRTGAMELRNAPRNQSERMAHVEFMQKIADKVGLTMAETQSVLWHFEKELYEALGAYPERDSYGTAAEDIARRAGREDAIPVRPATEAREGAAAGEPGRGGAVGKGRDGVRASRRPEGFRSEMEKAIEDYPSDIINKQQFLAWLRKRPGVRPTELEWTELEKNMMWEKAPKQEVLDLARRLAPEIQEVNYPGARGGENERRALREKFLTSNQAYEGARIKFWDSAVAKDVSGTGALQAVTRALGAHDGGSRAQLIPRLRDFGMLEEAENLWRLEDQLNADHKAFEEASGAQPKYEKYVLPGPAREYKETLLTMPGLEGESYIGGHFKEGNIVVHNRTTTRDYADGKTGTNIEEIQSDMNQAGREVGFGPREPETMFEDTGVPENPFQRSSDWMLLGFKAALRDAIKKGHDRVTWTTGEQQAERYNLAKQVEGIRTYRNQADPAGYDISVRLPGEDRYSSPTDLHGLSPNRLAEYIGKDLARKITEGPDEMEFSGLDLKVGGEGMASFYDRMAVNEIGKYVKRWGGKVGEADVIVGSSPHPEAPGGRLEQYESVHSVEITPEMREDILGRGQPMFSRLPEEPPSHQRKPRATVDDFRPGKIKGINDREDWAILEANDPQGKTASAEYNEAATERLRADLEARGLEFVPVNGKYTSETEPAKPGFLVLGIDNATAMELGKKYDQESILDHRGIVYQDGRVKPTRGITEHETAPPNFYTEIPSTGAMFTSDIDFDTTRYQGIHASPVEGLTELRPEFQGTGQMGAERKRLAQGEGQIPYINMYTRQSPYVENHRFGGKYVYTADLDVTNRPGGLIEAGEVKGRTPARLKAEGYTGIFYPAENQAHVWVNLPVEYMGKAAVGGKATITGEEYARGVMPSRRAVKPISEDLLPDLADATLDVDPANREAWERNAIAKFGKRIRPHLPQVYEAARARYGTPREAPIEEFVKTAADMVEAGVGRGRGLTEVGTGEISRPVDQLMGEPDVRPRNVMEQRALEYRADPRRRKEFIDRLSDPNFSDQLTDLDDAVARQEIAELSKAAIGDRAMEEKLIIMHRNYRKGRTDLARQLGQGGLNVLSTMNPVQAFRFGISKLLYGDTLELNNAEAARLAQEQLKDLRFSRVVPRPQGPTLKPEVRDLMATVAADVLSDGHTSEKAFRDEMIARIGPRVAPYLMTVRAAGEALRARPPKLQPQVDAARKRAQNLLNKLEEKGFHNLSGWDDAEIMNLFADKARFQELITTLSTAEAGPWRKFVELYRNGLLGAAVTVLRNGISNAAHLTMEYGMTKPVSATLATLTGRTDRRISDLGPAYREFPAAIKDAWNNAYGAFLGEYDADYTGMLRNDPIQQLSHIISGTGRGPAIGGKVGRFVRAPQRIQGAVDNFFGTLAANIEAMANARETARREGLTGADMSERVTEIFRDHESEAWKRAEVEASRLMFRQEMDKLGKVFMGLRSKIPGGELIAPFVATPYNIAKVNAKMMPGVGWLIHMLERKGTGDTSPWRMEDIVRPAMGPLIAAVIYNIAQALTPDEKEKGAITPLQRYSQRESAEWNTKQMARPQGTIETGRGRASYERVDPVSKLISAAAAYDEAVKSGFSPVEASLRAAGNYIDQFTTVDAMKSIVEMLNLVMDRKSEDALHVLQRNAAAMVPFSAARRAFVGMNQPNLPESRVWGASKPGEEGETKIRRSWRRTAHAVAPEFTPEPPPKVTPAGEQIARVGGPIEKLISPFRTVAFQKGPGTQLLRNIIDYNESLPNRSEKEQRAGPYWPGATTTSFSIPSEEPGEPPTKRYMSDEERAKFETAVGKAWMEYIMSEIPETTQKGHVLTGAEIKIIDSLRRKASRETRMAMIE